MAGSDVLEVPRGTMRVFIVLALLFSSAMVVPLLIYYCNRQSPSIRYRNPNFISIAAVWASIYSIARCAVSLNPDMISCTNLALLFGISLQTTLMSYLLAEIMVVLTFNLTERMTKYSAQRDSQRAAISRLQWLLRRKHVTYMWLGIQVLWNLPNCALVLSGPDYSRFNGTNCPDELRLRVIPFNMAQYCCIAIGTLVLSRAMSRVVDNFGVRKAFQNSSRAMCVFVVCYLPVSLLYDTSFVQSTHLELFIVVVGAHVIVVFHVLGPIRQAFRDRPSSSSAFKGTLGILEAFLHTDEGYKAFTAFAKGEYEVEVLVAWRALADYRGEAREDLSATDIFDTHLGPNAPLPVHRFVPPLLLHRYETAFAGNAKYGVHPDSAQDPNFFNPLHDALLSYMVHTTLPRFQAHEVGAQIWRPFVLQYETRLALDLVLQKQAEPATQVTKFSMPNRKIRLETIQSLGNLGSAVFTEMSVAERRQPANLVHRSSTVPLTAAAAAALRGDDAGPSPDLDMPVPFGGNEPTPLPMRQPSNESVVR
ncbi:hypothetical protein SPRG_01676 [Saprolegnia parasitica CBS 223.65]|uniref:RGS domain-containing protein n=1 Tax=Saprolegnia parasitica (strain CBS 223.65) TaxID=695850 RepID=A0A067D452_SAPPC|nr:hypothetical protein SPRG_01676 [Saprolegnia parasitica CBS 223.65]KDO33797.1 hypothetical protein SPRG_01676 [Saprolegnia parasitica CBS 223.65]|eukprot:XP_012195433.1 hypothetical protein SPRG_01676 [Saprolegnia parasitica CBS 223.65]